MSQARGVAFTEVTELKVVPSGPQIFSLESMCPQKRTSHGEFFTIYLKVCEYFANLLTNQCLFVIREP